MTSTSSLKAQTSQTLAWIAVLPFLAIWPFLSAFPAFALFGASAFDLSASLNIIFLLTGFWPLAGVVVVLLALLHSNARGQLRSMYGSNKGLLLGAYSILWTGLYMIAAIASR